MPLNTFPIPKQDKRFFTPNKFGIDPKIYQAIVLTAQEQVNTSAQLTDAVTITTDASIADNFYVTLAGNRTMDVPTNSVDWKRIRYVITQDAVGSRTLAWHMDFRFSATLPSPTLTITALYTDILEFIYNPNDLTWDCTSINKGFAPPP